MFCEFPFLYDGLYAAVLMKCSHIEGYETPVCIQQLDVQIEILLAKAVKVGETDCTARRSKQSSLQQWKSKIDIAWQRLMHNSLSGLMFLLQARETHTADK